MPPSDKPQKKLPPSSWQRNRNGKRRESTSRARPITITANEAPSPEVSEREREAETICTYPLARTFSLHLFLTNVRRFATGSDFPRNRKPPSRGRASLNNREKEGIDTLHDTRRAGEFSRLRESLRAGARDLFYVYFFIPCEREEEVISLRGRSARGETLFWVRVTAGFI